MDIAASRALRRNKNILEVYTNMDFIWIQLRMAGNVPTNTSDWLGFMTGDNDVVAQTVTYVVWRVLIR